MDPAPERPDLILWMDAESGLIVGMRLDRAPLGPHDVAACLEHAISQPMAPVPVPPPTAIRVPDAATAAAVRSRLGTGVPVRVGPVPELDAALADMRQAFAQAGGVERSYLEAGSVSADATAGMFHAAAALWRVAPWRFVSDDQVLAVDVPALDVSGACLSVMGGLGESFGFVLFESFAGYERFVDAQAGETPDMSGMMLSLAFERRRDLTETMRREIAEHQWPVAGARAHPVVLGMDADGVPRPTTERDTKLGAACAEALAEFAVRHRRAFENEGAAPVREELHVPSAGPTTTVRLTYPHPALRAAAAPPVVLVRVGRNDPCPCGSGRKYKRCHLRVDEARPADPATRVAALIAMDQRLADDLHRFGSTRFGGAVREVLDRWKRGGEDVPREEALLVPWIAFHKRFDGRALVSHFLERRAAQLSGAERAWLEVQRDTPLSVWQVTHVVPDDHLVMEDRLTGRRCTVYDRSVSASARPRDVALARVVDHEGVGVLCGVHPRPLPATAADKVVRRVKRLLRTRAARVPGERLADESIVLALAAEWERAVEAEDRGFRALRFTNTEGEPLLITVDHFAFEASARAAVEARLATLGEREAGARGTAVFTITRNLEDGRPGGLVVGHVEVGDGTLRVETNSVARADAVRRDVEAACGSLVRHRAREHADPRAALRRGERPRASSPPLDSPEAAAMVLAFKRDHYTAWLDESIPALGGLTPREAARQAPSRRRLELLLQDMERLEAGMPEGQRFDFGWVRGELGLDTGQGSIVRVRYRAGMVQRLADARRLPWTTIEAADLPADLTEQLTAHVFQKSLTLGDPAAGDPIQYDEIRIEGRTTVTIVVRNRAILLFTADGDEVRRIHRVCCALGDLAEKGTATRGLSRE
jgi:hypothetical protein